MTYPEWQTLANHQSEIAPCHMRDWFAKDHSRFSHFSLQAGDLFLDYSRNRITDKTMTLLCDFARAIHLPEKIDAIFSGFPVNTTENRPALHMALRDLSHTPTMVDGVNIASLIQNAQTKLQDFVTQIHSHAWKGITGKPIRHIVNIGIGGSYTGPMMTTCALSHFKIAPLEFHFISTVDQFHLTDVLQRIDPETTLFIISSKSFSTLETLTNAQTIFQWMKNQLGHDVVKHHFVAVTASIDKAIAWGLPEENIFPLWHWVGGRYSIWSAIGLPLMLMIGNDHFKDFLKGAYFIDQHFKQAPFEKNMPVILALLGIWYMHFFDAKAQALIPYAYQLRPFIAYLQQADMESNGKNVGLDGDSINYPTTSILFGEEGCIGQHAYHQLLHQGQHFIPVDFILVGQSSHSSDFSDHQDILLASGLSQAQALMRGKTWLEAKNALLARSYSEKEATYLAQHQMIPGNRPSNIIYLEKLTPASLGSLIALYEHKIFVQGVIWNINSFDQWGVELGKELLPSLLQCIQHDTHHDYIDHATHQLIDRLKKGKVL